jgi:hypothetical protein
MLSRHNLNQTGGMAEGNALGRQLCELVEAGGSDMALCHLLILVCVAVPIGTSLSSARYANVGPGGYVLAVAVGLSVGVCCGWMMWKTHKFVGSKLQQLAGASFARQEWYFRWFHLAKFLWVAFAGFLGFWISLTLLRLVF